MSNRALDAAIKIGEEQSSELSRQASQIRRLKRIIVKAYMYLESGRAHRARKTLEQVKDV